MKKYCYFVGLIVIHPLISARYSYLTTSAKNNNHSSPPLELTKHTQAAIPAYQTAPDKKYKRNITAFLGLLRIWLLARFYVTEKDHRFPGQQLENLTLLKIIKTNTIQLWNNHRPRKEVIKLVGWRG